MTRCIGRRWFCISGSSVKACVFTEFVACICIRLCLSVSELVFSCSHLVSDP